MSKVVVRGAYHLDDPRAPFPDEAYESLRRQMERDVLAGTFDEYDASIFARPKRVEEFQHRAARAASCFDARTPDETARGIFPFRLELDPELFDDPAYGLQRLVHMLASDVFLRRVGGHQGRVEVRDVEFGDLKNVIEAAYRPRSHNRQQIRAAFRLRDGVPLLAFSLKPRACLTDEDYHHIVRAALVGGCQLVELDTRDLVLHGVQRIELLERLSRLAIDLSQDRVCRFSVNLSGPLRVIEPVLKRLAAVHAADAPHGPFVIKIDGNLDGLSTVQAIRAGVIDLPAQPIITCYPVLKYALQAALGPDAFVRMLAMSGIDIIYPGRSPDFGRSNNRIDVNNVARAREHYLAMDMGGYPMLSVAGGIAINSVHACLSVLGPDIAFFVGGGIATSKQGIEAGASNFAKAIDLSCQDLVAKTRVRGLEEKFIELSKIYFAKGVIPADYEFIQPASLRGIAGRLPSTSMKN